MPGGSASPRGGPFRAASARWARRRSAGDAPPYNRGSDERMTEPRLGVHHDHPLGLRRLGRGWGASEPGRRPGDQPGVT